MPWRAIAIAGGSPRARSPVRAMAGNLCASSFGGSFHISNPIYEYADALPRRYPLAAHFPAGRSARSASEPSVDRENSALARRNKGSGVFDFTVAKVKCGAFVTLPKKTSWDD